MTSPFNPYQAPAHEPLPSALAGGDFDIGQTVKDAFERTREYVGPSIGMLLLGGLLMALAMFTVVGYFVVVPVLAWGMIKFFLNVQDRRQPQLNDLFAGFSNYGTVLGRMLLVLVCLIGLAILGESVVFVGQFMKSVPITVAGYVIYLVFLVLVLSRLYFAIFFVVDRDMGALESLAASWRVLEGKGLKIVGLGLLAGLIGVSGVLALCVGLLFTIPMSYMMYISAYRQVVGHAPPPALGGRG